MRKRQAANIRLQPGGVRPHCGVKDTGSGSSETCWPKRQAARVVTLCSGSSPSPHKGHGEGRGPSAQPGQEGRREAEV